MVLEGGEDAPFPEAQFRSVLPHTRLNSHPLKKYPLSWLMVDPEGAYLVFTLMSAPLGIGQNATQMQGGESGVSRRSATRVIAMASF